MVPIALLYVKNWEEECCKQKKEEFREQFRESIQTLSAILKVGYSVENAIRETWKEICPIYKKKTRIIKEYETMVHQLDLNMSAPSRMELRVTSMATLPPPMTTTCLPVKSGISLSPMARSISTAEMTFLLFSPGMPVFLS